MPEINITDDLDPCTISSYNVIAYGYDAVSVSGNYYCYGYATLHDLNIYVATYNPVESSVDEQIKLW